MTTSSDSEADSSTSLDHSHEDFKKHAQHHDESRYSHTNSENKSGDTQGSLSHGTSGTASQISTVSIDLVPFKDFYENANTTDSADDSSDASSYEI